MPNLSQKKVILISPRFFDYDMVIERALINAGADVQRLVDRPFENAFTKAATKLFARLVGKILEPYYFSKIGKLPMYADYVLVINGQTLSRRVLLKLKSKNPNAKFLLYMWDSIENRPGIIRNFDLYDEKYSFDKKSAKRFGLTFRPLFYENAEKSEVTEYVGDRYAMSFIGTAHSDRYAIIKSLSLKYSGRNFFWYMYLQAPWVFWWYRLTNSAYVGARKNEFCYAPLPSHEMKKALSLSDVIVDIENARQVGLTIRTFDIMKSGKKMITTNQDVVNYDFYLFGNIHVIDRLDPSVPDEFMNRKFTPYNAELLYFYSIDGWIEDVLGLNV
jgi:hypothetical protein